MKPTIVVVTGGPSGGKTTLIEALKKNMGPRVSVIPEAATILYRGGFPRLKGRAPAMHTQRAIYGVQKELEALGSAVNPRASLIVCDRGSLDGIAYWPDTEAHYFRNIRSSRRRELARYDWVLHLDTAGRGFYDSTNPVRTESFRQAVALNERIKHAWRGHPRRLIISQNNDFVTKIALSLTVVRAILDGRDTDEVRDLLAADGGR